MGKTLQAPWGYQCPYRQACPHLEGMSTEWMWRRHQEDIWEKGDLRRRVEELVDECHRQERSHWQVEACQAGRDLRQQPLSKKKADELKDRSLGRLMRLSASPLSWEAAEQLRCRLRKQRKNLFTFIHHPEIEPTNNQAEQSLRRSVIMRKVTLGNRSPEGARRQAMLTSLITTAQRQGRDPRAALQTLWIEPLAVAQAAFYRRAPLRKATRRKKKNASARSPSGRDPPKTS